VLVHIPLLDALLAPHVTALGRDAAGYRNHTYRVVNLGWSAGGGDEAAFQRLVIAAAFHDLGIWSARSFDYIAPSRALARAHLKTIEREPWIDAVDRMIDNHHRVRRISMDRDEEGERFRRADWADVSCGLLQGGFDADLLDCVRRTFPSHGFHCGLARRALCRAFTHPFDPLPMLRW
jgi:hypothetical protein